MNSLVRTFRLARPVNLLARNMATLSLVKPMIASHSWQPTSLTTPLHHYMSTHAPQHKNAIKSSYQASGFYVEQILTGCLAIYSYYIESGDECIIIDPVFDTREYTDLI